MANGYVAAEQRTDDNGNVYYVAMTDAWATEELAREFAADMGISDYAILHTDDRRIIERRGAAVQWQLRNNYVRHQ